MKQKDMAPTACRALPQPDLSEEAKLPPQRIGRCPLPLLTARGPKPVSVSRTLLHPDTTGVRHGETRLEFSWGDASIATASTRRDGFTAWSFLSSGLQRRRLDLRALHLDDVLDLGPVLGGAFGAEAAQSYG